MDDNIPAPAAPVVPPPSTPISVITPTERISVPAASALGLDNAPGAEADSIVKGQPIPVPPPEPAKPVVPPEPAKPVVPEPVKPVVPPEPAKPVTPPEPEKKTKIGDKEYTVAELEAILAGKGKETPPPVVPAPVVPPTKEEIAARETEWKTNFLKNEGVNFAPSEEELDKILAGGADGVKLFASKLNDVVASAVMHARKSIFAAVGPELEQVRQALVPVLANQQELVKVEYEQAFLGTHPDFKSHISTAREVAAALVAQFPEQVAKLTREQFNAEVARQSDNILTSEFKRFNPGATTTWRDAAKAVAAVVPPAPAAPVVPPAPVVPAVPPPPANVPSAQPTAPAANTNKAIARSLQD